jgi:GH24 family phage-related lysozyme (muramidase)
MNADRLIKDLIRFEGFETMPYICSADKEELKKNNGGKPRYTIGVGHLIRKNEIHLLELKEPLSQKQVYELLNKDLNVAVKEAKKFIDPDSIEPEAWEIVCHLSFWLGLPTLNKFKKFKSALEERDYVLASEELIDSNLYRSPFLGVKNRIVELSARMRDI